VVREVVSVVAPKQVLEVISLVYVNTTTITINNIYKIVLITPTALKIFSFAPFLCSAPSDNTAQTRGTQEKAVK